MPSNAFFWDRIANKYAKQPVADEESYQKKLAHTQSFLTPDSMVLEFGCGTGSTAIHHAPNLKHIHATDISSRMLGIAKAKAQTKGLKNISFEQTQLIDLESPNKSWDLVLGMSILHLLSDWEAHIVKVYELLKPGGVFVSSTACIADMNSWIKTVAPIFRLLPILPNVQVFSQQELKAALIKAGFEVEHEWRPQLEKGVFMVARKPKAI